MRKAKQYRREQTSKKVKAIQWINIGLILFMFAVVIHDSFVHELPFYYILFVLAGLSIGSLVSRAQKISFKHVEKNITLDSSPVGTIITLVLIGVRYFAGKLILDEFNIVWTADAIYLFFIGIYYSKIQNIIRQINDGVYTKLFEDN